MSMEAQMGKSWAEMARKEGHMSKLPGHFSRIGVTDNLSLYYLDYMEAGREYDVLEFTFLLRDKGYEHTRQMVIGRLTKLGKAGVINKRVGRGGKTFWSVK